VLSRSRFMMMLGALGIGAPAVARAASEPPWYPLPPPLPLGKGRALVLSGAGARGAYEAGALKWLFRDVANSGQPFDVICGTSAGAINTAFAAQGTPTAIAQDEELWKGMPSANILTLQPQMQDLADGAMQLKESGKHGYPAKIGYMMNAKNNFDEAGPPNDLIKIMGVMDDSGIDGLIKKYPLSLDAVQTSLFVTATNITNMTSDSFYHFVGADAGVRQNRFIRLTQLKPRIQARGQAPPLRRQLTTHHALTQDNFVDAVVASAAVPGVFQPVPIVRAETGDTNLYVDGGVANNTPIDLAVDAGATDITMIIADAIDEVPPEPGTLPQLLLATNNIMAEKILENDVVLAVARNLLSRRHNWSGINPATREYLEDLQQSEWQPIVLRVIRPRTPLKLTMLGFNDQTDISAAFDQGYTDAQDEWVYSVG
jgi:predicted acylesterase/phospholipase RssA